MKTFSVDKGSAVLKLTVCLGSFRGMVANLVRRAVQGHQAKE